MNKVILLIFFTALLISFGQSNAQGVLDRIKQKAKDKVNQKAEDKADKTIDKTSDEADNSTKTKGKEESNEEKGKSNDVASIKTYQNYDFVPGDKIVFEDNFVEDQDGEFPSKWELIDGQGVVNRVKGGDKGFFLTEGNYARAKPRIKKEIYLTDPFTIEFDTYYVPGSYGTVIMLLHKDKNAGYDIENSININSAEVSYSSENGVKLSKSLPEDIAGEEYSNRWHHIAIACKNSQLKVYVDQYRVLVVPDTKSTFDKLQYAGIGDDKAPLIIKNFKIALGGSMNMIGKKFTESKIVTHGITFDVDKAIIKPESMGTLNMVVQVLKENPDLKFEIDGHTDNSGDPQHNLKLSQQRAEAVKSQLVSMGVEASRLTAKGFGDTKPISDNNISEGKANNRRVELVKQ